MDPGKSAHFTVNIRIIPVETVSAVVGLGVMTADVFSQLLDEALVLFDEPHFLNRFFYHHTPFPVDGILKRYTDRGMSPAHVLSQTPSELPADSYLAVAVAAVYRSTLAGLERYGSCLA